MSFQAIDTNLFNQDNMPGVHAIYLVPVDAVVSFPTRVKNAYAGLVVLENGEQWVKVSFSEGSCNLNWRKRVVANTERYNHKIRGVLPKQRYDILNKLMTYNDNRFLAICEDVNGGKVLLGTIDKPCFFGKDADSGNLGKAKLNHYRVDIEWESTFVAPYYEQDIQAKDCGPVQLYVDGVFHTQIECGTTYDLQIGELFNLNYRYRDPSASFTILDEYEPHTFAIDARILGLTGQNAAITEIEYSKDDVTYAPISFPLDFVSSETLYLRTTKTKTSTSGWFGLHGEYQ